ncbi:MAG: precorrin-2 dehydrogenase/sirohydrochlorin ferrochelatase family protein [Candidatus Aquicultor sp.]
MAFYPLYIDLESKKCVVIGGGDVAERKVMSLIECGADVTVVSPQFTPGLARLAEEGRITATGRGYEPGDVDGATLAIVATDNNELNRQVHQEATKKNIPVNVVDVPELCSFIVPSTVRRGDLVISISTSGSCPALAKHIRKQLQDVFGSEYARYCEVLKDFRAEVNGKYDEPEERKQALNRLLKSDVLDLIKQGNDGEVEKRVRSCI